MSDYQRSRRVGLRHSLMGGDGDGDGEVLGVRLAWFASLNFHLFVFVASYPTAISIMPGYTTQ